MYKDGINISEEDESELRESVLAPFKDKLEGVFICCDINKKK